MLNQRIKLFEQKNKLRKLQRQTTMHKSPNTTFSNMMMVANAETVKDNQVREP